MKPYVISWMTPEETEQFLKELKAPGQKDPNVSHRIIGKPAPKVIARPASVNTDPTIAIGNL